MSKSKTVLVVEDNPAYREMVVETFKAFDYTVIEADNGEIGLKLFKLHRPDYVCTDNNMPKMCGQEMIHKIREIDKDCFITLLSGDRFTVPTIHELNHIYTTYVLEKTINLFQYISNDWFWWSNR